MPPAIQLHFVQIFQTNFKRNIIPQEVTYKNFFKNFKIQFPFKFLFFIHSDYYLKKYNPRKSEI